MRIAFASIDGTYIDQHFGSARYFQIFDVTESESTLVESRKAKAFCNGHCEGGFDQLLELLGDCDAVFALKIGQGAAAYMIGHGKRVFEAFGTVDDVIEQLQTEGLLEAR